jgi:hypothetical protein
MWRDQNMWRTLQNSIVVARHMKNHAIVAACGANHVFRRSDLLTFYAVVCKEKWPKSLWNVLPMVTFTSDC